MFHIVITCLNVDCRNTLQTQCDMLAGCQEAMAILMTMFVTANTCVDDLMNPDREGYGVLSKQALRGGVICPNSHC